jgi:hypothetical protein
MPSTTLSPDLEALIQVVDAVDFSTQPPGEPYPPAAAPLVGSRISSGGLREGRACWSLPQREQNVSGPTGSSCCSQLCPPNKQRMRLLAFTMGSRARVGADSAPEGSPFCLVCHAFGLLA